MSSERRSDVRPVGHASPIVPPRDRGRMVQWNCS